MAPRVGPPAAWVVLCTLLCADATSYIHTDLGPYPGPDNWADVPQATRRVRTRCTTANFLNTADHGSLTPARMPVRRQWAAARLCTRCRRARRGGCSSSCTATCSTPTSGACRRPRARTAPARTRAPAAQHGALLVPVPHGRSPAGGVLAERGRSHPAGLPEEMVTVYQATQRGYAVVAFDPLPETAGPDGTRFDVRCASAAGRRAVVSRTQRRAVGDKLSNFLTSARLCAQVAAREPQGGPHGARPSPCPAPASVLPRHPSDKPPCAATPPCCQRCTPGRGGAPGPGCTAGLHRRCRPAVAAAEPSCHAVKVTTVQLPARLRRPAWRALTRWPSGGHVSEPSCTAGKAALRSSLAG